MLSPISDLSFQNCRFQYSLISNEISKERDLILVECIVYGQSTRGASFITVPRHDPVRGGNQLPCLWLYIPILSNWPPQSDWSMCPVWIQWPPIADWWYGAVRPLFYTEASELLLNQQWLDCWISNRHCLDRLSHVLTTWQRRGLVTQYENIDPSKIL